MSDLSKYMEQIRSAFPGADASDLYSIGKQTFDKVGEFLTNHNAVRAGAYEHMSVANEALTFDDAMTSTGVEELQTLVKSCGIADAYLVPCCEAVLNIIDRCLHRSATAAWTQQNMKGDAVRNGAPAPNSLSDIYASDTVAALTGGYAPSTEAFGVNVDLAVPDLKIAVSVAIMNYHTRLLPRILPTKPINQPQISFTKEYLEVYDLKDIDGKRARLVDLYQNPEFAANELTRIVPMLTSQADASNFLVADDLIKFGVKANILKLSLQASKPGFTQINRTDLIAEGVKLDSVTVSLTVGSGEPEQFKVAVPLSINRLTRMVNAADSAMRNADIKFRVQLRKGDAKADGTPSTILSELGDNESVVLEFNLKPTISLKFGLVDCLGSANMRARHDIDNSQLTPGEGASKVAAGTLALVGYTLDARFSEENLRKTNIAIWTHRQPFSYDVPIGRNYVYDYAIGQDNAEEHATNLTKVIGIGQDDIALRTVAIRTLEDVADRLAITGTNPVDKNEYVGKFFVAGDKVRPAVFKGTLDFSALNIIRDADRSGDIKQKTITFLNAVTTKVLYDSFFLQQIGGAGVTFKCVTSLPILGNVIGVPHIHDHMNKEDQRDIGDGVEYVLVLPNGVRIEFVTSTFDYMADQMVMWPVIKNNADSELNYAVNLDYGTMVAHYTPSGEAAHHRMFANIRELPIVLNPVGIIISVAGMDVVNGISQDNTLRPVIEVDGTIQNNGTVVVSGNLTTTEG